MNENEKFLNELRHMMESVIEVQKVVCSPFTGYETAKKLAEGVLLYLMKIEGEIKSLETEGDGKINYNGIPF